jgi:peptide/nickel transport system ATP-binding protein
MVFQDPFGSLNPAHRVKYTLERALKIHQKMNAEADIQFRTEELLETVGLKPGSEVKEKFPYELSGGQRQRVAFARALAVQPKVLLADEPVSMLDVSIRVGILNLMDQLKVEQGLSLLYITHDIASARYIGDQTNVMYAGRMVESAESRELIDDPAHPYTRLLLSAVPNPHAGLRTTSAVTKGEIPSLVNPPAGCPFAPRCPHVMPVCREVMPGATHIGPGRWVRCHLHGPGEDSRQSNAT